jgi:hypothetical protein
MALFSVEIIRLPGSLLGGNQHSAKVAKPVKEKARNLTTTLPKHIIKPGHFSVEIPGQFSVEINSSPTADSIRMVGSN